ncbi:MAG TPA: CHAP domain-containing protein, partial [Streptosporangiaceae bacterium]
AAVLPAAVLPATSAMASALAGRQHLLLAGQSLQPGQQLSSPRGTYRLVMQGDGNLVEYAGSRPVWSSGTAGTGSVTTMLATGNLVVTASDGSVAWQSGTAGQVTRPALDLRRGGNFVITSAGQPIWSRVSSLSAGSPGDTLLPGASLTAPNGAYQLVMQPDGDLVEYRQGGTAVWSAHTAGTGNSAWLRADGDFVVSASQGGVLWQTGTGGRTGGFTLDLRANGTLALYSGALGRIWRHSLTSGLVLGAWPGSSGTKAAAAQYGYPYPDPPACTHGGACVADKWYFYRGQCTSWVAYRLNQLNGFAFSNYYGGKGRWGNADNWGPQARSLGITVNSTPALGSIAWYSSGHVAYVEAVNSATSLVISEMNYDSDNGFRVQTITPDSGFWPTAFIHVHDR